MSDNISGVEKQTSYGIGYQMGEQLASNPFDGLCLETVARGINDGFNHAESAVSSEDLRAAFNEIHTRLQAAKQDKFAEVMAKGEAYLAKNATRDEVTVTESGLQYEVINKGSSDQSPNAQSTVRTHYHGTLLDGSVFDSSYDRGQPAEFPVGGVIKGWTEALQMMNVGDKWRLHVPSELAYGEQGAGGAIGPYETLVFDVELLEVLS